MRIDVYVGEAPDEGDGYGGATETSAKVGIGTLRKSEQSDPPKRRGEPMADPDTRSPFWDTPEGQRILDKPVKKYSENQPRDWHGRFGSGTGDMPDHVKFLVDRAAKFYAAGGTIKKASDMEVPELNSVQRTFTVQSDDVRDGVSIGQSVKSEDERARLEDGCQFAAGALHDALKTTYDYDALIAYDGGGRPCAAISFHLPVSQSANPSIEIGVLGSNKTVDGAACALQCELAGIASSMNSSVVSMFTDDSRAYHMLIGRQLSGHQSTWTNEQCAKIASAKIPLTNKSVIGTIRKYAEDQPRDDHGRFSTEGSTATGTERSTPMSWQTTGDGLTNFGVGEGWMLRNIDVVHSGLGFVHEESRHDLPADEEFAVNRYILGAAYSMNNGLRGGKSLDSVPYARDIQNAISKSSTSKDVTVFRGGVSDSGAIPDNVQVGDVVEDRGFVSTSMTELTAKNFGDGSDPVEIHVPAGSNAIGCATSEQEVLLGSGSQFRIDSMPPHGKWQMTYVGLSGSTEQASKMVKSTGGGEEQQQQQQQQSRFTWQPGDVTVVRKDTGKISVGTLRKDRVSGETQPHGAHGHFASGSDGNSDLEKVPEFKTKDEAEHWFADKGIVVMADVHRMRSIGPDALRVVAQGLVRMDAKHPGLMDEVKIISKCPSNDAAASVSDRRYGGYNRYGNMLRPPEGDGSRLTLSPMFGKLVSDPEYLAEFVKQNEGYNTIRTPDDVITHELSHALVNMTDAANGVEPSFTRLMSMREWSRPSEVQDAVTAAYGRSPALSAVRDQMAKDLGSEYATSLPAEFIAEANVIIGDPERLAELPDDAQQRLRTFQTEMNKSVNYDIIKAMANGLDGDDMVTSEIIDDFGMPQSFWDWSRTYIGDDDEPAAKVSIGTLRKDRVSGESQAHGAHGHFASGGEGSSQASERTRLGRLRDRLSGGRSHQPQSEIGQARYPSPKPTKDVSYFKEHIGEIADRAYPPGSLPLGITPSFKDGVDAYMSSESSAQQKAEGNKLLKEMVDEQWPGGGKATVLNPEEFKQYVREENATVFYRGFHTHPDYGDSTEVRIAKGDAKFTEFVNGDRVGLGTLLHGTYFGEKAIAVDYAKTQVGSARQSEVLDPARSRVVQAVLKPDARVATITQSSLGMASSLAQELGHLADPDGSRKIASTQASNIAAEYIAKGFDAVRVKNANLSGGDAGTYTVVFNTGALIVAGDNGTSIRR